MADASVTFMTAGGESGTFPLFNAIALQAAETVASAAASSAAPRSCYARIHTSGAMRVLISQEASPVAASTDMRVEGDFHCWVPKGAKIAVLDA